MFDFTLGNIFFQLDKLQEARTCYAYAIRKFPDFLRAHKNLGLVAMRLEAYPEAHEALTRALSLGAVDDLTYGLLGSANAAMERPLAAESAYRQALMLRPSSRDWQLGLAQTLFRQSRYAEAAALADELIEQEPERVEYWTLKANSLLGNKKPMEAAKLYEYLDLKGMASPAVLHTLGDIYVNEGVYVFAAEAYRRAAEKDPEVSPSRSLRNAEVLGARGAVEPVELLLNVIRDVWGDRLTDSERSRLLRLQARVAAARGAGTREQISMLEEIVQLNPLDGDAIIQLARHYAGEQEIEKAILYLERAAAMESFEASACLRLGQILVRESRYQEAVPRLKRALELDPRDDVQTYLEQVERLARNQ